MNSLLSRQVESEKQALCGHALSTGEESFSCITRDHGEHRITIYIEKPLFDRNIKNTRENFMISSGAYY